MMAQDSNKTRFLTRALVRNNKRDVAVESIACVAHGACRHAILGAFSSPFHLSSRLTSYRLRFSSWRPSSEFCFCVWILCEWLTVHVRKSSEEDRRVAMIEQWLETEQHYYCLNNELISRQARNIGYGPIRTQYQPCPFWPSLDGPAPSRLWYNCICVLRVDLQQTSQVSGSNHGERNRFSWCRVRVDCYN